MEQLSLFDDRQQTVPLASRIRPTSLEDFVGQQHLLGPGKMLRQLIEKDQISSMIFWGPPGVGKTTLASIIASRTRANFINFSAVTSGIKEIKDVMSQAEQSRRMGERTVLFVDEIHRFNKAQQDAFLPFVERGSIVLIGATTENPSFEVNAALLSRCKVFVLKALEAEDLKSLIRRALSHPSGFGAQNVQITDRQIGKIAEFANGDARTALNTLEMAVTNARITAEGMVVTDESLAQCISRKSLLYDKNGEEHYNLISALHKSMRNSDPDAAIYWMCRMLEGGEDPLYIARRLIRFASEDVGMADSQALQVAVAAYQACHFLGMPECDVHLTHAAVYLSMAPKSNALYRACESCKADIKSMPTHAVTYLAMAPKSNALYTAVEACKRDVRNGQAEPVPLQLRNAPTRLMKELDYGKDYEYAHDTKEKLTHMECLPENLIGTTYYHPTDQGKESQVKERLQRIKEWKNQKS